MNSSEVESYFTGFVIGVIIFTILIMFYAFVILPRDRIGFEIMYCMNGDRSPAAYEACRVKVMESHAR